MKALWLAELELGGVLDQGERVNSDWGHLRTDHLLELVARTERRNFK